MFCNKCNINWARLHVDIDHEGEETYDICPKCMNDSFLEPQRVGDTFIHSPFDGRVINVVTKQDLYELPVTATQAPRPTFDYDAWRIKKDQEEKEENANIDKYIKIYNEQGPEAARKAFFQPTN